MSFPVNQIALKVYPIDREFATGLSQTNDNRAETILGAGHSARPHARENHALRFGDRKHFNLVCHQSLPATIYHRRRYLSIFCADRLACPNTTPSSAHHVTTLIANPISHGAGKKNILM